MNTNKKDPIVIAMCSDNSGADFMQVAIKSIFINNKDENIELHIVTDGFDDEVIAQLKEIEKYYEGKIIVHQIDYRVYAELPGCGEGFAVPKATCFRFAIPELLRNYNKVLYLDTDVIVEKPLTELWQYEIEEFAAAVVLDPGEHVSWEDHILNELKFESDTYFNAGVILMNLIYMRDNEIGKRSIEWLVNNPDKALFADQTALNVLLMGKLKYLPPKYNLQYFHYVCYEGETLLRRTPELEEARKNPVIIHFTVFKPWQKIGIYGFPNNSNRYNYYRSLHPKTLVKSRKYDGHTMRRRLVYALYKMHIYGRTPATIKGCFGFDQDVK